MACWAGWLLAGSKGFINGQAPHATRAGSAINCAFLRDLGGAGGLAADLRIHRLRHCSVPILFQGAGGIIRPSGPTGLAIEYRTQTGQKQIPVVVPSVCLFAKRAEDLTKKALLHPCLL